jgi:hypothetical protein
LYHRSPYKAAILSAGMAMLAKHATAMVTTVARDIQKTSCLLVGSNKLHTLASSALGVFGETSDSLAVPMQSH